MNSSDAISFSSNISTAPGYISIRSASVAKLVSSSAEMNVSGIGSPAAAGDLVLLGSNGGLICINARTMCDNMRASPLTALLPLEEVSSQLHDTASHDLSQLADLLSQPVRDVRWVSLTTAVCAVGEGKMQLFSVQSGQQASITPHSALSQVHSQHIRELAVQTDGQGILASGGQPQSHSLITELQGTRFSSDVVVSLWQGFDGCLCITDVHDGSARLLKQATMPGEVLSSVKWPKYNTSQRDVAPFAGSVAVGRRSDLIPLVQMCASAAPQTRASTPCSTLEGTCSRRP